MKTRKWNGTRGDWQHGNDFDNLHEIYLSDRSDNIVNVKDLSVTHKPTREEIFANVTLIVDAGNTIQKCDLMPSELLKQRDELLEAMRTITNICDSQNNTHEEIWRTSNEIIKQIEQ